MLRSWRDGKSYSNTALGYRQEKWRLRMQGTIKAKVFVSEEEFVFTICMSHVCIVMEFRLVAGLEGSNLLHCQKTT